MDIQHQVNMGGGAQRFCSLIAKYMNRFHKKKKKTFLSTRLALLRFHEPQELAMRYQSLLLPERFLGGKKNGIK
jgi:hypothetical protein